ncbi:uncharacterized protein LOC128222832 [Mya arenaria]|uniref:uncharacterized protein LOC128222832 n=1 Tax=Mya arenaria TaxID=6604 RepID=UPI0022E0FC86|nr:uncharacterized protein LOC128222832 [Mya arenaria]
MVKKNPKSAKTGKRKADPEPSTTGGKQSRLAVLLANVISKDDDILQEIGDLINSAGAAKPDGTAVSIASSVSSEQDLASVDSLYSEVNTDFPSENAEPEHVSLGAFSAIHPPLDQKLADKILNGEYVDFASIIHRDHLGETMTIKKTNNSTVTSIQKASAKRITEIDQWNKAFQIYADIYSAKYHSQAPQLFRYMSIIQNLSHNSQQWIAYDEKFRRLRAASPSIPWGTIHTETYLFCCMMNSSFRGPSKFNSRPHSNKIPAHILYKKGYCWEFQESGACNKLKCTVSHQCSNCEGPHGACGCPKPFHAPKRSPYPTVHGQRPHQLSKQVNLPTHQPHKRD